MPEPSSFFPLVDDATTAAEWLLRQARQKTLGKTETSNVYPMDASLSVMRLSNGLRRMERFRAELYRHTCLTAVPRVTDPGLLHGQILYALPSEPSRNAKENIKSFLQPDVTLSERIPGEHLTKEFHAARKRITRELSKAEPPLTLPQIALRAAVDAYYERGAWLLRQDDRLLIDYFAQARRLLEAGHIPDGVGENVLYQEATIAQPTGRFHWIDTGKAAEEKRAAVRSGSTFRYASHSAVTGRILGECGNDFLALLFLESSALGNMPESDINKAVKHAQKMTIQILQKLDSCSKIAGYPHNNKELMALFGSSPGKEIETANPIPLHTPGSAKFLINELNRRALRTAAPMERE